MIPNYLYTIGKHLSPQTRDEVLKDIEVNLYDYLEENFGKKVYSDQELEVAIRSMGHPRKVAEAYMNRPRGLIGPVFLDTYWLVNKISVIGIAIGLTVANIMNLAAFSNGVQLFLNLSSQIVQTSLMGFGIITLVFAALQHFSPEDITEKDAEWSLKILEKAVEPQQKVKLFDLIVEAFFLCLGLVFINQIPSFVSSTENTLLIFNKATLEPYLLWFNLLLGASLAVNIYLLIVRRWQPVTRNLTILLDLAGITLFTIFAFDPNMWSVQSLANYLGSDPKALETGFRASINVTLAVIIIISAFDIFGHFKALIKRN